MMMMQWLLVCVLGSGAALLSRPVRRNNRVMLQMTTAADATTALAAADAAVLEKIKAVLPIELKQDQCWLPGEETVAGKAANLLAYDAPGKANVAWLSCLDVAETLSSLTVYNGPLTDVPHLYSRAIIRNGMLELLVDWRPRAYGAYETRDMATNEYPPPASREAFTQSGARTKFEKSYYTPELMAWLGALSFEGATSNAAPIDLERLARGPATLDVVMPLTQGNVEKVAEARTRAAEYWLGWAQDESHVLPPGMKVTSTYAYDTKLRANLYGSGLDFFNGLLGGGEDAKKN